jgi:hypothetical protein
MEPKVQTFREFLKGAFERGQYTTDDVIAFLIPLFKEVLSFHESNQVAPFEKEETLFITEFCLDIDERYAHSPKNNIAKVLSLYGQRRSKHIDIVENLKMDTDVDGGYHKLENLNIHLNVNEPLANPAFVPGYCCYEILVGHHDAQTDIFCLGLILGSIALGLDLNEKDDLEMLSLIEEILQG